MSETIMTPEIIRWIPGQDCCDPVWEAAYNRFETPDEEREKFRRRLRAMGIDQLPKSHRVADLFCGRGNNLTVLEEMGFTNLVGVDLSPALLALYKGPAQLYVGDCRDIRLPDASRDLVIVQGGLHHLPELPADLDKCFSEIERILAPDGIVVFVEPWLTPFLRLAHLSSETRLCQKILPKLEALHIMIEHEKTTYYNWLGQPALIRGLVEKHFDTVVSRASLGKWYYLGKKK